MKKILVLLGIIFFAAILMGTWPYVEKSADHSADALIDTGEGVFFGYIVTTDGTNPEACTVYDNTSAAGDTIVQTITIPTSATERSASVGFGVPVHYTKGIYMDCAATGTYKVYFVPMD